MIQRYKLLIEYDGTDYSGWQKQPEERTVEGEIEKALSTLYQLEIDVIGQGRTDAGVHALEQVAHVDLPDTYNKRRILHAMRGLLPDDVTIFDLEKTHSEFHSRFDAISRKYIYRIANRPIPIDRHKIWYSFMNCDIVLLNKCANLILGEHDFHSFCIANDDPNLTTQCTITESIWRREDDLLIYTITGNRFLRQMVRRLVGTMVQVSAGKIDMIKFEDMLTQVKCTTPAYSAPPSGLTLVSVGYDDYQ
ncbi:MAG: tRNA pseudouridine(38-40) synthase TruA [Candidatus Paceibacterota bacterium]